MKPGLFETINHPELQTGRRTVTWKMGDTLEWWGKWEPTQIRREPTDTTDKEGPNPRPSCWEAIVLPQSERCSNVQFVQHLSLSKKVSPFKDIKHISHCCFKAVFHVYIQLFQVVVFLCCKLKRKKKLTYCTNRHNAQLYPVSDITK